MTNQRDPRQAGTEIEITPEMIEAGAEVVSHFRDNRDDPKEVARDVFEAMMEIKVRGSQLAGER